ncbi:MAG TPA: outer membrane beta-barrel protein [Candidatus Sulfotelmatobacter sp.]|nr:outer membrane beta-barrel protein [Candidatus Sulfotelmatobacter sp.]
MRKIVVTALALLTLSALAAAQVPTSGNVFFGYSYYNTDLSSFDRSNTHGWEGSLEGRVFPHVGIVVDLGGHYGSQNFPVICTGPGPCTFNANVSEHNVLFGPRVSASIGRFRPFAEAMFGVGHVNANAAGSDTSFATALGGGIDYRIIRPIAWRFQGDYVRTHFFGTAQNNLQLSTGIVLRF